MNETEKIIVNGKESEIPIRELNLFVHKDVMDIKVPDRFEINPENTLEEIRNLSQKAWTHISTGDIFQYLFRFVFPLPDASNHSAPKEEIIIPAQLEDLQKSEMGVRHIAGLIILAITKGGIEGKELFFKLPESYLHPAYQCNLADLFIMLPKVLTYMQKDDILIQEPKPPTAMESWLAGD